MANVTFGLSDHELSREERAVTFVAHKPGGDNEKIGELVVSKGGIRWYSKGQKKTPHFLTWQQLDQKMQTAPRK